MECISPAVIFCVYYSLHSPTWDAGKTEKKYIKTKSTKDNSFLDKWSTDEWFRWTSEHYIYVNIERCDVFSLRGQILWTLFMCNMWICSTVANECLPSFKLEAGGKWSFQLLQIFLPSKTGKCNLISSAKSHHMANYICKWEWWNLNLKSHKIDTPVLYVPRSIT